MKLPAGRLDLLALVAVLALGAWLRFQRLDLLEFKGDEAYAMHVVLRALDGGGWPQVGLVSSVKILNPPLFLYLLAPLFAISASPVFVCCAIATLNLLAVVIAWHVGRKYYGATAGTVAALLFAVSPWAVIYSRKIWAQDFVPLFAACVVWALHAVVFGGRRAAIFWVVLLVLLCPQVHFSGLALWGGVVGVLLWLRPKIDWRWAVGGLVAAVVPLLPYLRHQVAHNWEDVRRAARTIGGQGYRIPKGVVVDPQLGYALPRRDSWWQALWILNSGGMEDILGLSTRAEFDPNRIWPPREYFRGGQTDVRRAVAFLGDAILAAQRLGLLVALVWLAVGGGRQGRLLVAMTVAPVGVFVAARLWTVQSYFVVLYPALFLVLGAAAQSVRRRRALFAVVVVVAVANIWFVLDLFDFVGRYGGAHGSYGTVISHKLAAARFLRTHADLKVLMDRQRLWQMDRWGEVERARLELPVLAARMMDGGANTNVGAVLIVDLNRADFGVAAVEQVGRRLGGGSVVTTNFGPMYVFLFAE